MKKLGKKVQTSKETLEAYCRCSPCATCYCGCNGTSMTAYIGGQTMNLNTSNAQAKNISPYYAV